MKSKTKKILQKVQSTICNDLMSWDELADKVLELEAEIERLNHLLKKFQNAPDPVIAHRRNRKGVNYNVHNNNSLER